MGFVFVSIGVRIAAWGLAQLNQTLIPLVSVALVATFGILAVAFFLSSWRWTRRFEFVRFKDTVGRTVFEVGKEKEQAAEAEAFILELRQRILRSKPGADNKQSAGA